MLGMLLSLVDLSQNEEVSFYTSLIPLNSRPYKLNLNNISYAKIALFSLSPVFPVQGGIARDPVQVFFIMIICAKITAPVPQSLLYPFTHPYPLDPVHTQ